MPRERNPNRDRAAEIFREHGGNITNRQIAELLDENEKVIAVWKQRDKEAWGIDVVQQSAPKVVQQTKKPRKRETLKPPEEPEELTERQRLFCIYFVKSFNATSSAIKAGYAPTGAHVEGSRLLRNPKVAEYIRALKQDMTSNLFLEAVDVLNKYVKIAFTDITDFLTFGQKDVPVMSMFGPLKNEDGTTMMKTVNFVDFRDSGEIDGSLISEVKQGKDGVSIKLTDKMKALDKLAEYFDLFPDKFKRQIQEEQQKMAREKLELEKMKANDGDDPVEDDGFIEALKGQVSEVWGDGDAEED